jgi:ankyrin repeat protein
MTPLMMACNYSSYEFVKLFLFWGAKLDLQDNYKFTALLYSVKSNSMPLFFYFISLGADFH